MIYSSSEKSVSDNITLRVPKNRIFCHPLNRKLQVQGQTLTGSLGMIEGLESLIDLV